VALLLIFFFYLLNVSTLQLTAILTVQTGQEQEQQEQTAKAQISLHNVSRVTSDALPWAKFLGCLH
jgi:hypothetical protein